MKQPTLKEVKKHFKKALMVESPVGSFDGKIKIKSIRWYDKEKEKYITCDCDNSVGIITLWGYDTGYSKILTYKEKTFSITESKINELSNTMNVCDKLKEWFPEAFESEVKELKVGTWYKVSESIFNHQEGKRSYGILRGKWQNGNWYTKKEYFSGEISEATEQEVFEALKNEAVKRGYKERVMIKNSYGEELISEETYFDDDYEYDEDGDFLYKGFVLFQKGKWAEIIPTITLSEAEQQLGKKIIV